MCRYLCEKAGQKGRGSKRALSFFFVAPSSTGFLYASLLLLLHCGPCYSLFVHVHVYLCGRTQRVQLTSPQASASYEQQRIFYLLYYTHWVFVELYDHRSAAEYVFLCVILCLTVSPCFLFSLSLASFDSFCYPRKPRNTLSCNLTFSSSLYLFHSQQICVHL